MSSDDEWLTSQLGPLEDLLPAKRPKYTHEETKPKPVLLDSDAVLIPTVFLTAGEDNHRIVRQDDEIRRQILLDEDKTRRKREAFDAESHRILHELNMNGCFTYTWKHDSQLVESYVQRLLAGDPALNVQRHFHNFKDQKFVVLPSARSLEDHASILLFLDAKLVVARLGPDLTLADLVLAGIASTDIQVLTKLCEVIDAAGSSFGHMGTPLHSLHEVLTAIGRIEHASANLVHPILPLRLVQFNHHIPLLLHRLSAVFKLYLLLQQLRQELEGLFMEFVMACCDFLINKDHQEELRKLVVWPVLPRFLAAWSRLPLSESNNPASRKDEIHSFLALVRTAVGLDSPDSGAERPEKSMELHYTMLMHIVSCDQGLGRSLAFKFLDALHWQDITAYLNEAKFSLQCSHQDFYKASVLRWLVSNELHRDDFDAKLLLAVRSRILEAKDKLQDVIGRASYSNLDDHEKVNRTAFLSEAYHVLDSILMMLERNVIFFGRDFFYRPNTEAASMV